MALRVLSWNVEHFRNGGKIETVAKHIQSHDPDVFALYEIAKASMALLAKEHDATVNNGRMESESPRLL